MHVDNTGMHMYTQTIKWAGTEVGSYIDMQTCGNTCTQLNQGLQQEDG